MCDKLSKLYGSSNAAGKSERLASVMPNYNVVWCGRNIYVCIVLYFGLAYTQLIYAGKIFNSLVTLCLAIA